MNCNSSKEQIKPIMARPPSKTPWIFCVGSDCILDDSGNLVMDTVGVRFSDATLIVKAVNAYAKNMYTIKRLMSALEKIADPLRSGSSFVRRTAKIALEEGGL